MSDLLLQADALHLPLADNSVQCVVTSPPYWGLRDYGIEGQLGLEPTPDLYVEHMVAVFREVRRVLRDDGTLWLNLGDSYCGSAPGNKPSWATSGLHGASSSLKYQETLNHSVQSVADKSFPGLKSKDLVGIPWRVAFALQADGWWLRSDIIWSKPNPMPESVTDRPTKSHEYLFLMTKSERYFYDGDAIAERAIGAGLNAASPVSHTRNRRSVWTIATEPYHEAHFATFPQDLVEPCVMAGTSEKGACAVCGAPWERDVETVSVTGRRDYGAVDRLIDLNNGRAGTTSRRTIGWRPTCAHTAPTCPCLVLDPFAGSGTTVLGAKDLGRHAIGCDLKPDYLRLARDRTRQGAFTWR